MVIFSGMSCTVLETALLRGGRGEGVAGGLDVYSRLPCRGVRLFLWVYVEGLTDGLASPSFRILLANFVLSGLAWLALVMKLLLGVGVVGELVSLSSSVASLVLRLFGEGVPFIDDDAPTRSSEDRFVWENRIASMEVCDIPRPSIRPSIISWCRGKSPGLVLVDEKRLKSSRDPATCVSRATWGAGVTGFGSV